MTFWPLKRQTVVAAALGAVLLSAACSPDGSEGDGSNPEAPQEGQDGQAGQNPIPQPEYDSDDTTRLPIGLISPAGHNEIAPIDDEGQISESRPQDMEGQPTGPNPHQTEVARTEVFGCSDTISVVQTVPMVTEDPAHAALDYLFSVEATTHGSPEFGNSLALSEGLSVESVELDGDEVTVSLDGVPAVADSCDAWRVLKQVETTARIATGASAAQIQADGVNLAEQWGLGETSQLQITEIDHD